MYCYVLLLYVLKRKRPEVYVTYTQCSCGVIILYAHNAYAYVIIFFYMCLMWFRIFFPSVFDWIADPETAQGKSGDAVIILYTLYYIVYTITYFDRSNVSWIYGEEAWGGKSKNFLSKTDTAEYLYNVALYIKIIVFRTLSFDTYVIKMHITYV